MRLHLRKRLKEIFFLACGMWEVTLSHRKKFFQHRSQVITIKPTNFKSIAVAQISTTSKQGQKKKKTYLTMIVGV